MEPKECVKVLRWLSLALLGFFIIAAYLLGGGC